MNNQSSSDNNSGHYYAFLPLITDPGDVARNRLFCPLAKSELKYTKRSTLDPQHPPMFACITRTSSKVSNDRDILECHGFICSSTEEAVSIAAQLYQALIDTIKAQGVNKKYRLSRASSISMGSMTSFEDLADISKESPKRPVRRKKVSNSGSGGSSSRMSVSSCEQPPQPPQPPKVTRNSLRRSKRRSLKKRKVKNNVNHWKKSEEDSSTYSTDISDVEDGDEFKTSNGDIYTKVAMPRSRSFMKINNSQSSGTTSYNLQDLFKELKDQVNNLKYCFNFHVCPSFRQSF